MGTEKQNGELNIKKHFQAYAVSKGPDQPAHLHSLIRAFIVC